MKSFVILGNRCVVCVAPAGGSQGDEDVTFDQLRAPTSLVSSAGARGKALAMPIPIPETREQGCFPKNRLELNFVSDANH